MSFGAVVVKSVLAVVIVVLALCGCSGVSSLTDPEMQPTGPYSTKVLSGEGCVHTGPGWLVTGTGRVIQVRDVYYCAITTDGAVIPVSGPRFNVNGSEWTFMKTNPAGNNTPSPAGSQS